MRVGISIGSTFFTDGPRGQREGTESVLAQARAAARAGLHTLSLGDHHSTGPYGYVQNVPMLARIAAGWTDRPLGCLFLVPLWNPVLMAEQIGTLATMAAGRFIVQTGLGGDEQFRAMGVERRGAGKRLEDGLQIVQALLRGETVDHPRLGIEGACVAPLPPEGCEWWMGGGTGPALDRAARLGDCWYGNADLTPATAGRLLDAYREACDRHGRVPARIPIRKDVYVAESAAEGERVGDDLTAAGYRGFSRDAVAYGDPQGVAEQLSVYGELGFTDVVIRTMYPLPAELGPDAAARSVELAGEVRALLA